MTPGDTRERLVEAALLTLKERGFKGCSAREIAAAGGLNQALVFYHYGSVQNLLLAVLDTVGERRMQAYGERFEQAAAVTELAALAREIYFEDLRNGYVTVLGEMVAGAVSDRALGAEVVARMQPWTEMVARKVSALVAGSPLQDVISPRDVAFAIIALYLGIDMLGHLDGDHARAESLLELAVRLAPVAELLLPTLRPQSP